MAPKQKSSGELIPQATMADLMKIEEVRLNTAVALREADEKGHDMIKAIVMAKGIQALRQSLTAAVMTDVMALMNTPLGFLTDRDPAKSSKQVQPYGVEVVRDCCIRAMIDGYRLVGNEINIISGTMYATKNGLRRRVVEYPGISAVKTTFGVPANSQGGALVSAFASWKLDGGMHDLRCEKTDTIDTRIAVRVNSGMGADAILGKAERKLYARILLRLTGQVVPDEDHNDALTVEAVESSESPRAVDPIVVEVDYGELMASFVSELGTLEMANECTAYGVQFADTIGPDDMSPELRDDYLTAIDAAVAERHAAIKEGRGERSNEGAK